MESIGKRYKIGYTDGVYDLFHVGHLNMIETAKKNCEYLIVGVHSDEVVHQYKHRYPIIPEEERARIVGAVKGVDRVVINEVRDKQWKEKGLPLPWEIRRESGRRLW